ncbi:hypothetical protein D3C71_1310830 [compost metagenome]
MVLAEQLQKLLAPWKEPQKPIHHYSSYTDIHNWQLFDLRLKYIFLQIDYIQNGHPQFARNRSLIVHTLFQTHSLQVFLDRMDDFQIQWSRRLDSELIMLRMRIVYSHSNP